MANIKDFCKKYIQKLKNDKDIAERDLAGFDDNRDRINFFISVHTYNPALINNWSNNKNELFTLDDDDLKYLYDKYSKRLKDEMENKIDGVKKEYEGLINC